MKNKTIGVLAILAMLSFGQAEAQYNTPTVGQGQLSVRESPCIPYNVGPATGTTAALILSGTAASPGKGWVNWVKLSTGAAESYLVLLDTGALSYTVGETDRVPYASSSTLYGTAAVPAGVPYHMVRYDPPMLFTRGITVDVFGCSGGCNATVCYRNSKQQTP